MIHKVIVLGGGSAGFLAALSLKKKLPELSVTVIHSKDIGIIGVGEATTVALPKMLHGHLDLDPGEFYRKVETTWKLGIRFLWGKRPFFDYTFGSQLDWKWSRLSKNNGYYCDQDFSYVDVPSALMSHNKAFVRLPNGAPLLVGREYGHAYHIENEKFVAFLEEKAIDLGVEIFDDILDEASQDDTGITGLHMKSGVTHTADLYVDCSGFRSVLLGGALQEPYTSFRSTLYNNRAVVGGWTRDDDEPIKPYTTAESMNAGWCWQIDHLDRINRGYVYSSDFISDEDAEQEFRQKNPKVSDTRIIYFKTGRYHRSWVKNVVAIGNSAGFVEPLESTGLAVICDEARLLANSLIQVDRQPTPSLIESYNRLFAHEWDNIRNFLGIHFKFNTRYDTPYWRAVRADTDIGAAEDIVEFYQENGPSNFAKAALIQPNDIFGMEGYLCLLVGQQVPYRKSRELSPSEWRIWNGVRAENRAKALTAMTVQESFDAITSPNWTWEMEWYRQ